MSIKTRVYIDTNIFLHYQPFDQIDWLKIVKSDSVVLVIPPVTIRELNYYKDSQSRVYIKKRASEAIRRLTGLFDSSQNTKLGENISVIFEDRDPLIDFAANHLSPIIQDDQLIANMIMDRQESPGDHLILITSDLGLTLSAKAGRHGIDTKRLPENLRLPDEPDQSENKIKQLEQQVHELSTKVPKLSLSYEDGTKHAEFTLSKDIVISQSDIEQKITELKDKYPKRENSNSLDKPSSLETKFSSLELLKTQSVLGTISKDEINRYNKEVESYLTSYSAYLLQSIEYENIKRRSIHLNITLANDGTTPAEDIDVYIHFPDGFKLLEGQDLPPSPQSPPPPTPPMTELEKMSEFLNEKLVYDLPSLGRISNHIAPSVPPPNVLGPNIKRTGSYDVHFHIQRVKHNMLIPFNPLFIIFDSFDAARSFTIEYEILAANLPDKVTGNLHVVIEKEAG